ncbi:hypothetical protein A7U60_g2786 [Sanghuangporus baumii]|uniref:Uncharacterized protein n=1 Tax=Sanghuangporus baumii TaxID=108892 RepID=A0A9Q5I1Q4_SANBA|nr:hypothetical protein A7U60_g2786 [Sanghuangporus baumii]
MECSIGGKLSHLNVTRRNFGRVLDRPRNVWSAFSEKRTFSSARESRHASDSPIRVSYLFGALLVFGIGATSWGLYEFYTTLTMWPKEVRGDLRAGLRAKRRGDIKLARRHLAEQVAWETIQTMAHEVLDPDSYLKYSGVAIILAEVLELEQDVEEAFNVLNTALSAFIDTQNPSPVTSPSTPSDTQTIQPDSSKPISSSAPPSSWTSPSPPRLSIKALLDSGRSDTIRSQLNSKNRMRAVALALKLGELSESLKRPEEEERWLGFAVTEVLRLIRDEYGLSFDSRRGFTQNSPGSVTAPGEENNAKKSAKEERDHEAPVRNILSPDSSDTELGLPTWVSLTKSELAAPMERLGAFYSRQGKYGNAILLYRVASSLLVRSKPQNSNGNPSRPSIAELCQALQIENAHMALLMELRRSRPEDSTIHRDLSRVLSRAVNIYDKAVEQNRPRVKSQDDGAGAELEMTLCDETYPAVFYNAGVYYEELGQLDQAFRSYSLSYKSLRAKGGSQEMMYDALKNARRVQRAINKNAQQTSQDSTQGSTSTPPIDSKDSSNKQ